VRASIINWVASSDTTAPARQRINLCLIHVDSPHHLIDRELLIVQVEHRRFISFDRSALRGIAANAAVFCETGTTLVCAIFDD